MKLRSFRVLRSQVAPDSPFAFDVRPLPQFEFAPLLFCTALSVFVFEIRSSSSSERQTAPPCAPPRTPPRSLRPTKRRRLRLWRVPKTPLLERRQRMQGLRRRSWGRLLQRRRRPRTEPCSCAALLPSWKQRSCSGFWRASGRWRPSTTRRLLLAKNKSEARVARQRVFSGQQRSSRPPIVVWLEFVSAEGLSSSRPRRLQPRDFLQSGPGGGVFAGKCGRRESQRKTCLLEGRRQRLG